jgi:hypothetical protein
MGFITSAPTPVSHKIGTRLARTTQTVISFGRKDSPKKWKEDVALWIYEMLDYIVRGVLKLRRKAPTWLDIPQNDTFYHHYAQRSRPARRLGSRPSV